MKEVLQLVLLIHIVHNVMRYKKVQELLDHLLLATESSFMTPNSVDPSILSFPMYRCIREFV